MLRTIFWLIYFWVYLIIAVLFIPYIKRLVKKGDIKKRDEFVRKHAKLWAQRLVRLAGGEVLVFGEENIPQQNAVYISNHQGNFDIPLMLGFTGDARAILAKIEMKKVPFINFWMEQLGCHYVDRKDSKQALRTIMDVTKFVSNGNSISIYPEGTRSQSDDVAEFKSGSSRVAVKSKSLIVPVTIDGSYKLMEKNKGFKMSPAKVYITIHKPIDTKELDKEEIANIDDTLRNIIKEPIGKYNT